MGDPIYMCVILLDLLPSMDSQIFIKSFKRFIRCRGCPSNAISDNGKNFVSEETQSYVNNLRVQWHVNLPMAPWHGGFFERLVRSVRELLRKELKCYWLSYEELQTVLLETECILNNRLITYYYSIDIEPCLTPNHLLYGRTLTLSNTDINYLNYSTINPILESQKLNNIVNHFGNRWQKEYLCNHREVHKPNKSRTTLPIIEVNDIVIVHVDKLPRSQWKLGLATEIIPGQDTKVSYS